VTLVYSAGPAFVSKLKALGFKVFVDSKLHDIPHQVSLAAASIVESGADMFTVHASGGLEMLKAACQGADKRASELGSAPPLILAITVLTSLSEVDLARVGVTAPLHEQVLNLCRLSLEAGLDGVVASGLEPALLRAEFGKSPLIVTPGIRPAGVPSGDQQRVSTPANARAVGADYLVCGRAITAAADPVLAFQTIVAELEQAEERTS
jgi:orotidine-5'-phosphate decarboxylase